MKAVITGATKGIGRAIAENLAAAGYDLAVCARNAADLEAMKADFAKKFPKIAILTQVTDVRDKNQVIAFATKITNCWSVIDILVNNAGVFTPGNIHQEPDGLFEQLMETNLYSAYYLTRALIPLMLKQKRGHIFNMCSIASLKAYPNGGSYTISKFALLGFSKVLREELQTKGIKVTAILPGATWTDSWAGVTLPESRLMQAQDIAKALLAATQLSPSAVIEEIVMRPQLGDL
jgi:NADP-dependent 3-hydroxy acid dehydrogenase YdfG